MNNGSCTRDFYGQKSSPDLILAVNAGRLGKTEFFTDYRSTYKTISDHTPNRLNIGEYNDSNTKTKRLNFDKASWLEYQEDFKSKLEMLFEEDLLQTPTNHIAQTIVDTIMDCAYQHIPEKTVCEHSKPFFTEELKEKLKICKAANNRYKARRDPNNRKAIENAKNDFIRCYQISKDRWLLEKCEELKARDCNVWEKINKIINGNISAPVQPLRIDKTNEFDFDDKKIAERMENIHIKRTSADYSKFDEDFHKYINEETEKIIKEEKSNPSSWDKEDYNADIQKNETKAAFDHVKEDSCLGPDKVHPILITKLALYFVYFFQIIFQTFWSRAEFPNIFKLSNVIYTPKANKDDYNNEKAYRPISLTSVIGKIFERIIARRLIAHLNKIGFFKNTQYAYQKGADTTQAILDMVLDIYEAFQDNKVAAAAFIDIEGAFDGIWRNALIYKLYKLGIRGRLLLIIVDFFQSRFARSLVNTTTTNCILTIIGIPQGSVLSAILFVIYISDMTEGIDLNVRYADDLNVYAMAHNVTDAAAKLESDLKIITKWCKLWRLNASPSKTSCMALTP